MLVVFASAHDAAARSIVAAWTQWDGALCTPADLSIAGWRHHVHTPEKDVAVVAGRAAPVLEIAGVLTRLPAVEAEDLPHIATKDRAYVAAEMTAFLSGFLSALCCPVLNRPSAGALTGPAWRREQWIHAAAGLGIPVSSLRRRTDADAPDAPLEGGKVSEVVVIGDRAFGDEDERPRSWTRALARTARVGYLGARFVREARGYVFLDAEVVPRLNSAETLDAARRYLLSGAHRALG